MMYLFFKMVLFVISLVSRIFYPCFVKLQVWSPTLTTPPFCWCHAYKMKKYMLYIIFILLGKSWRRVSNILDSCSSQMVMVLQTGHGLLQKLKGASTYGSRDGFPELAGSLLSNLYWRPSQRIGCPLHGSQKA